MAELIVQEWLSEFRRLQSEAGERLQPETLDETFVNEHINDFEIAEAIFRVFHDHGEHPVLVHDICQQLLAFYRCCSNSNSNNNNKNENNSSLAPTKTMATGGNDEMKTSEEIKINNNNNNNNNNSCDFGSILQRFSMQFIPVLIYLYLHAVANGDNKSSPIRSLETLLICMYNGEVSTNDGDYKILQFRMPILAQTSIYHEERNLPMTDLRRWEENCNREVKWGPHHRIETITAQNRLRIMTVLLFSYNQEIHQETQKSQALIHLCRVASQMVNDGFLRSSSNTSQHSSHRISYGSDSSIMSKALRPRIPLNSSFLLELVHSVYYAMFNGFATIAIQTLEDIHRRGCFEMYTDVILVTNAIRNSLSTNISGQPNDGPMGLNVPSIPSTTNTVVTATVSKFMITNASFRTKKLPDDIPIQDSKDSQNSNSNQISTQQPFLSSVSEETPEQTQAAISIRDQQQQQQQQQHLEQQQQQQIQTKEGKEAKESSSQQRNSIIRPSMEGIKAQAHKALIAGFKKAKDKDKDKDKEKEKEKEKDKDKDKDKEKEKEKEKDKDKEKEKEKDLANRNSSIINSNPRKTFDKHSQRNSLIQLPLSMESGSLADGYEKSPGPLQHKSTTMGFSISDSSYENIIEMLPLSSKLSLMENSADTVIMDSVNETKNITGTGPGSGSGSTGIIGLNVSDNLLGRMSGGGGGLTGGNLHNNNNNHSNNNSNSTTTTASLASNELLLTTTTMMNPMNPTPPPPPPQLKD